MLHLPCRLFNYKGIHAGSAGPPKTSQCQEDMIERFPYLGINSHNNNNNNKNDVDNETFNNNNNKTMC